MYIQFNLYAVIVYLEISDSRDNFKDVSFALLQKCSRIVPWYSASIKGWTLNTIGNFIFVQVLVDFELEFDVHVLKIIFKVYCSANSNNSHYARVRSIYFR